VNIDIGTVTLILAIVSVLQAFALFVQWRLNRVYRGPGWWALGSTVIALGYLLATLRVVPQLTWLGSLLNLPLYVGGLMLLHVGILRFCECQERRWLNIAAFVLFVVVHVSVMVVLDNLSIRRAFLGLYVMTLSFMSAWVLFRHQPRTARTSANLLGVVFALFGLNFVVMLWLALFSLTTTDILAASLDVLTAYLGAIVGSTMWTLGFILMVNQRLSTENSQASETHKRIFDMIPDAVMISRLSDGKIVDVNDGFVALSGFTRTDAIGKFTTEINLWKNLAERESVVAALRDSGFVNNLEAVFRRKAGGELACIVSARLLMLGNVPHIISVTHDITARKQTEEALRISETRHRLLAENAKDVVWVMGLDGRISYISPSVEQIRGLTPAEAMAQPLEQILTPDSRSRVETYFHRLWGADQAGPPTESFRGELEYYHKDGSTIWTEVMAFPVPNPSGGFVEILGVTRDISERKRTEAALAEAKEAAEAANRAKSQFLANMSHELRTPLNAILGFSELMAEDENLTLDQRENLAIINRSGDHLLNLINDVLDMAKVEAGRATLQLQNVDILQLLNDLKELFRARAADKGLALQVICDSDVPRIVHTDAGKLRQVLINLLGNAIKFTDAGFVELSVMSSVPVADADHRLRFVVQDTGVGITKDELAAIFEPFVQAGTMSEGTGLGLPISRQFARLLGGDLTVSSIGVSGSGSQFVLEIPVGAAVTTVIASASDASAASTRVWRLESGAPAHRLLVVEDRPESRKLLADLLTRMGFDVRAVENGQQALEVWELWQPHLIWMDINMPVMDGKETTRRIKATPQGQQTIVVAVSAGVLEDQQTAVMAAGCDDFVRKPFSEDEIASCLVKHLDIKVRYNEHVSPDDTVGGQTLASFDLDSLSTARMSINWIKRVRAAATAADVSQLYALVAEVEVDQPALSSALCACLDNFDYSAILAVVQKLSETAGES